MKFIDSQQQLHATRIGAMLGPVIDKAKTKVTNSKSYKKVSSFIRDCKYAASNTKNDEVEIVIDDDEI